MDVKPKKIRIVRIFSGLVNLIGWKSFLPEWDDDNIIYIFDLDKIEIDDAVVRASRVVGKTDTINSELYHRFIAMLQQAESEGRVFWGEKDFSRLVKFLVDRNIPCPPDPRNLEVIEQHLKLKAPNVKIEFQMVWAKSADYRPC